MSADKMRHHVVEKKKVMCYTSVSTHSKKTRLICIKYQ